MTTPAKRDARGRLLPGAVLNPAGRPKTGLALAETIRAVAGQPEVLREWLAVVLDVAFGRPVCIEASYVHACADARRDGLPPPPRPPKGECIQPTMGEIQRAWEFLATWGFKKPAQEVEMTLPDSDAPIDLGRLTDAELAQLEKLQLKAAGILDIPPKE